MRGARTHLVVEVAIFAVLPRVLASHDAASALGDREQQQAHQATQCPHDIGTEGGGGSLLVGGKGRRWAGGGGRKVGVDLVVGGEGWAGGGPGTS